MTHRYTVRWLHPRDRSAGGGRGLEASWTATVPQLLGMGLVSFTLLLVPGSTVVTDFAGQVEKWSAAGSPDGWARTSWAVVQPILIALLMTAAFAKLIDGFRAGDDRLHRVIFGVAAGSVVLTTVASVPIVTHDITEQRWGDLGGQVLSTLIIFLMASFLSLTIPDLDPWVRAAAGDRDRLRERAVRLEQRHPRTSLNRRRLGGRLVLLWLAGSSSLWLLLVGLQSSNVTFENFFATAALTALVFGPLWLACYSWYRSRSRTMAVIAVLVELSVIAVLVGGAATGEFGLAAVLFCVLLVMALLTMGVAPWFGRVPAAARSWSARAVTAQLALRSMDRRLRTLDRHLREKSPLTRSRMATAALSRSRRQRVAVRSGRGSTRSR